MTPHGTGDSPLLRVHAVRRLFRGRRGRTIRAVDGVSFDVARGELFALVGESGCGKSTLARVMTALLPPSSGRVLLDAEDVHAARGRALGRLRRRMQMVFQNPYASLDPRMTVEDIVAEGLFDLPRGERSLRAFRILDAVGLSGRHAARLPHQLSGGQRQRVAIARALAVEPELLVADELFSALDASVAAQIAELLRFLQREHRLTCVLIAHDLALAARLAHRMAVMHFGRIVEVADAGVLFARPIHPYAQALLDAVSLPDPARERARSRPAALGAAGPAAPAPGACPFAPRCVHARVRCGEEVPALRPVGPGRMVACHFWQEAGGPTARNVPSGARG